MKSQNYDGHNYEKVKIMRYKIIIATKNVQSLNWETFCYNCDYLTIMTTACQLWLMSEFQHSCQFYFYLIICDFYLIHI